MLKLSFPPACPARFQSRLRLFDLSPLRPLAFFVFSHDQGALLLFLFKGGMPAPVRGTTFVPPFSLPRTDILLDTSSLAIVFFSRGKPPYPRNHGLDVSFSSRPVVPFNNTEPFLQGPIVKVMSCEVPVTLHRVFLFSGCFRLSVMKKRPPKSPLSVKLVPAASVSATVPFLVFRFPPSVIPGAPSCGGPGGYPHVASLSPVAGSAGFQRLTTPARCAPNSLPPFARPLFFFKPSFRSIGEYCAFVPRLFLMVTHPR